VWSKQELHAAQMADSDIKVVAAWLSEKNGKAYTAVGHYLQQHNEGTLVSLKSSLPA